MIERDTLHLTRRGFLGAAAGTAGVGAARRVRGEERATYVVAGIAGSDTLRRRVARLDGVRVRGGFVGGRVLVVDARPGSRAMLGGVSGVVAAIRNLPVRVRPPPIAAAPPAEGHLPPVEDQPRTAGQTGAGTSAGADTLRNDEYVDRQWDKRVTSVPAANEVATGDGTTIAVVDTGIDPSHPDLAPNVNVEASRLFRNGRVGRDARDVNGHGTFVAGVAAASAEGREGIVGTAPEAELVSLRVFYVDDPDGDGTPDLLTTPLDWVLAVDYAERVGADVANLSLGLLFPLPEELTASDLRALIELLLRSVRPQVVPVVAAGNDDQDLGEDSFDFPGSVASAVTVGATGPDDLRVFYSTYGEGFVDLGAPGGGYSTVRETLCRDDGGGDAVGLYCGPGVDGDAQCEPCPLPEWPFPTNLVPGPVPPGTPMARESPTIGGDRPYAYSAGTSFAAPQVAGAAALMREVAPDLPADRVQRLLRESADPVEGESVAELGTGRLNAARAVELAVHG